MEYIVFDIETAGLEPGEVSILEFGAVIDDFETPLGELPTFRRLVYNEQVTGNHYALGMHVDSGILKELQTADPDEDEGVVRPDGLAYKFARFLYNNGFTGDDGFTGSIEEAVGQNRLVAAGKNIASFDIPHVEASLEGFGDFINFHHRVLDPGPLYFDPKKDDTPPNLSKCMERAGFENTETSHTAVADSKDVVKLLRHAYGYQPEAGGKVAGRKPTLPFK
jgi:hypothetical protein